MSGENQPSLRHMLKNLGDTSSLHGIPKIIASRQLAVKILWGSLLCGAVVVFCLQFRLLLMEYYSYPVKTSMSLKFAALPFPAVTVCNMNPVKYRALQKGGNDTTELKQILFSDNITWGHTMEREDGESDESFSSIDSVYDYLVYDDMIDRIFEGDNYDVWKYTFLSALRDTPSETRERLGHQVDDFILRSQYNGVRFPPRSRFKTLFNTFYGNCFTIDDLADAFTTGQKSGLTLTLNLEVPDYLELFASALGAIVVIHEKGTFPLPERDGLILNAGFETSVGLKMTSAKRLGGVYGPCDDLLEYKLGENYYKHSVPVCHTLCESALVSKNCGCATLETPVGTMPLRTCNTNDTKCVDQSRQKLLDALLKCDCPNKCSENSYVTTISGRQWPFLLHFTTIYMNELCKNSSSFLHAYVTDCEIFYTDKTVAEERYDNMNKNLLKVNIYFEDLNFEEVSEEPLYNTIRFLSDIGGMMGLFLGASLLTYVELLQLIVELMLYMKERFWKAKIKPVSVITVQP